ncbi:hypothetical protein Tph_c16980 [Thermacetogenium phaeum DSM 12270]|uniref:Uncharacterized protein n=1 Tax=Thermacetogenium phaeum (strain ATCC BAA-254 / DSM 26808 / PB) TaxID=1089553 RepID=K4LFW9_THEPS|nr:hypothetical protein [Thermacetogenium phaeum]AFV11901.1 hypothetical protein Tph_c16980 [Thermacetogenium phaeum DSM 12270]
MSLPVPFPHIKDVAGDYNPAIRLFGKRFSNEQTIVEYLAEFLAVVFSDKRIGNGETIESPLPSLEELRKWYDTPDAKLFYKPPIKLNLKLLAFLGISRVDSRHYIHKKHYENLINELGKNIKVSGCTIEEVKDWIEDLLRGFQGAGFNRTWCAQTFYPVSAHLLTQETIWNETVAKKQSVLSWHDTIKDFNKFYSTKKRDFLSRGGELLYLQLCNVFANRQAAIEDIAKSLGFCSDESNLSKLHRSLQEGLKELSGRYTAAFERLVDYLELLDRETHELTDEKTEALVCEWCPEESWLEGYLFAVEINRLLAAVLDPVERLELLMTGFALHVLRSLCAQSLRYARGFTGATNDTALGYAWIFSPPASSSRQLRLASQRNLQFIQGLIQKSLRSDALQKNAARDPRKEKSRLYKEADTKYGHKLFLSLGKKLGMIVPKKGPGARFIMTDKILRYLVLVLLRPGERCTYDEFLRRLYYHYGIAIEGKELIGALNWSGLPANSSVLPAKGSWLAEMLRAGGFLTELSDACSIVRNTFSKNN